MKTIFFIIATFLNYNVYAFSFSSIFPTHKHRRVSAKPLDYTEAKQNFAKYCTKKSVAYGVQIRCTQIDEPKNFKFDASATIKCKQKIKGVHDVYPDEMYLPHGFIKQMNLCPNGKIFGPNVLHTINASESESGIGIQRNQTETFYDIVCNDSQGYVGSMYKNQQAQYDMAVANKFGQCVHVEDATSDSLRYILFFKIFVGLAIFSFMLRFYFKYRSGINKFFSKWLSK